jgi:hypothetical protein
MPPAVESPRLVQQVQESPPSMATPASMARDSSGSAPMGRRLRLRAERRRRGWAVRPTNVAMSERERRDRLRSIGVPKAGEKQAGIGKGGEDRRTFTIST